MYSINYIETKNNKFYGEYNDLYLFESLEDVDYYLLNNGFKLNGKGHWSKVEGVNHVEADISMVKIYKRNYEN